MINCEGFNAGANKCWYINYVTFIVMLVNIWLFSFLNIVKKNSNKFWNNHRNMPIFSLRIRVPPFYLTTQINAYMKFSATTVFYINTDNLSDTYLFYDLHRSKQLDLSFIIVYDCYPTAIKFTYVIYNKWPYLWFTEYQGFSNLCKIHITRSAYKGKHTIAWN